MRPSSVAARLILSSMLVFLLAATFPRAVRGDVRVEGETQFVTIQARDASIAEVIAAVGVGLGLRIRLSTAIDQVVSGTYQGPVQRVIGRLLGGRDYIAKYSDGAIDIIVLGPGQSSQAVH